MRSTYMYTVHVASELIDYGNSKNEERKNPRGTETEKSKQTNKQTNNEW